jgi:hypothetical protein
VLPVLMILKSISSGMSPYVKSSCDTAIPKMLKPDHGLRFL